MAEDWAIRWSRLDAWKASELATLCLGRNPAQDGSPDLRDERSDTISATLELVRRGIVSGALQPIQKNWSPYHGDPEDYWANYVEFRSRDAATWALQRFPETFPLGAVPTDGLGTAAAPSPPIGGESRSLGARERSTLLTIIAALAHKAKLDLSEPFTAALQLEEAIQSVGGTIGRETVGKHLKDAYHKASDDVRF